MHDMMLSLCQTFTSAQAGIFFLFSGFREIVVTTKTLHLSLSSCMCHLSVCGKLHLRCFRETLALFQAELAAGRVHVERCDGEAGGRFNKAA